MRVAAPPACSVAQSALLGVQVPKHWGVALLFGLMLTLVKGLTIVEAAGKEGSVETSTLNFLLHGDGLFNVLARRCRLICNAVRSTPGRWQGHLPASKNH